jgi:hypothetical protein
LSSHGRRCAPERRPARPKGREQQRRPS